ncbi:MAG: hypothetical protein J6V53_04170 [Alphaproteobacteria bacterium]|nr:hypothetical protein [Alphaproteobacteria bacterium]
MLANVQRKNFISKLLKKFDMPPVVTQESKKNKLVLEGDQKDLIRYVKSLGTNILVHYNQRKNQIILELPLALKRNMTEISYAAVDRNLSNPVVRQQDNQR